MCWCMSVFMSLAWVRPCLVASLFACICFLFVLIQLSKDCLHVCLLFRCRLILVLHVAYWSFICLLLSCCVVFHMCLFCLLVALYILFLSASSLCFICLMAAWHCFFVCFLCAWCSIVHILMVIACACCWCFLCLILTAYPASLPCC